jgi:molybdate transport system permease protein
MSLQVDIEKKLPGFHLEISFRCDQNTLGLLGSSGSGKSMTLRCIAGLETPTKGHISHHGRVLFDSAKGINLPPQTRKTGFVFPNYALFPHLTVAQNICLGLRGLSRSAQMSSMEELLATVRMSGFESRYPAQLSSGQQQRAALARVLAPGPNILLLDEPFSSLDSDLRGELEQQLSAILKNFRKPSVFVTHNLDEAYRLCPELLLLHNGKAVACGAREDLFSRPPVYEAARLTACQNISRARRTGDHEVEAMDWGCRLLVTQSVPDKLAHVGIRAHQIRFTGRQDTDNTFPCSIKDLAQAPDHVLISVKLGPSDHESDLNILTVRTNSERSAAIQEGKQPLFVKLPAKDIILMSG